MSELPDGLPNTCLDCISTSIEPLGNDRFKLVATKNGNHAMMIVDINSLCNPLLQELGEQLD